jgi:hypothetical protein
MQDASDAGRSFVAHVLPIRMHKHDFYRTILVVVVPIWVELCTITTKL